MVSENNELLQKANAIAVMFEKATDVPCYVIEAKPDATAINAGAECHFCIRLQRMTGDTLSCREAHINAAHEAWRFGGQYIFMCQRNLLHFVSPLMKNGQITGMFLGGPVMIIEPNEYMSEEIEKKYNLTGEQRLVLRQDLDAIPVINTAKVTNLADMLSRLADGINSEEGIFDNKYIAGQQSQISGVVHQLKELKPQEKYPLRKETQMLENIRSGNKQESQRLLNDILGHIFFSSGGRIEIMRARTTELVVLLSRCAMESGADSDKIFGMSFQYMRELSAITTIDQLSMWLSAIITRFIDTMFSPDANGISEEISRVMLYIRQNCMNKLTLQEAAEYIYLTPTYFSRLFKQKTGVAFSDYLNTVRVEAAKEMLHNPKLSLVDIASFAGFDDQSYFCRVFKKYTGVSPKQYRKCGGNINLLKKGDKYGNLRSNI